MEKEHGSEILCRVLDEREEVVVDRERNVFDPILSVFSVSISKERLWQHNSQGNDILNACSSFLYYFSIEQTLPFLEFVEWCVNSYSSFERVIMSHTTSKILCIIAVKCVHGILSLPDSFPVNPESFNEEVLIELYKNCKTEVKCQFLSSILKVGQSLEGLFLPYNVNIFKDEVQLVMSIVNQFLGLDDDTYVNEVILVFFVKYRFD